MKRFIITDLVDGTVKQTDSVTIAQSLRECEEYFVVDTTTGYWLLPGNELRIPEEI